MSSSDEERSRKTTEALLEEVVASSKAQNETAKSLDTKATTMITISATTTSLLIGFATALLSRIDTHFFFFNHVAILLGGGLILTIVSIVIFLISARPRGYFEALSSKIFFRPESKKRKIEEFEDLDRNKLEQFVHASPDKFMRYRIEEYLIVIRKNSRVNESRYRMIYIGELVFVANIVVILISIMLQLQAVLQGELIQPTTIGG
jgi:hypothetical protein